MPANPRPACQWPSWNPDTNRDSWIWSDKQSPPKKQKNKKTHPSQAAIHIIESLTDQHKCLKQTPTPSKTFTCLLCIATLDYRNETSFGFDRFKLSVVQRTIDNYSNQKKSKGSPEKPSYLSVFLLPVFVGSVCLQFPGPPSVTSLLPAQTQSARTIKHPVGQTGRKMESDPFETISHIF